MKLKELLLHPEAQDLYTLSSTSIQRESGGRHDNRYFTVKGQELELKEIYRNHSLIEAVNAVKVVSDPFYPMFEGVSLAYGGTQYGYFNPELGDGRSYFYNHTSDSAGNLYDVVVKGHITSPYSQGNGYLACDTAMVEQYLGEKLTEQGIDAERVLYIYSVSRKGEEKPYTAISVKLRRCSLRLGSLQLYYYKDRLGLIGEVCKYLDQNYYHTRHSYPDGAEYDDLFLAICSRTGTALRQWMEHGFVHGRLSSDNFSLVGEAIDIGSGFFTPEKDKNAAFHEDYLGYYSFGRQAGVIADYLYILAYCIRPYLLHPASTVETGLNRYREIVRNL